MINAVDHGATTLKFYEVNYDLNILNLDWLNDVRSGDVVVLIDYFGFPSDKMVAIGAKEKNAWVLRDASQALLSVHDDGLADIVLFSPRKFLGVPDGGVLIFRDKILVIV